jgi:hypothetical protein
MTVQLTALPPVAKSFSTKCTKCDQERYHRVISHVDEKSAKIECEICHKKSTFKLKPVKAAKAKSTSPKKPRTKKATGPSGPSWEELQQKLGGNTRQAYSIKAKYSTNVAIEHPKFGLGFVVSASGDRIEAMFQDGVRTLVHARP